MSLIAHRRKSSPPTRELSTDVIDNFSCFPPPEEAEKAENKNKPPGVEVGEGWKRVRHERRRKMI